MKLSVDRIENNIAILIKLDDKTIIEEDINRLPEDIYDGSILIFENDEYIIDKEDNKKEEIRNLFDELIKK